MACRPAAAGTRRTARPPSAQPPRGEEGGGGLRRRGSGLPRGSSSGPRPDTRTPRPCGDPRRQRGGRIGAGSARWPVTSVTPCPAGLPAPVCPSCAFALVLVSAEASFARLADRGHFALRCERSRVVSYFLLSTRHFLIERMLFTRGQTEERQRDRISWPAGGGDSLTEKRWRRGKARFRLEARKAGSSSRFDASCLGAKSPQVREVLPAKRPGGPVG